MTDEQKRLYEMFTTKPKWIRGEATLTKRGWTSANGELLLGRRTPEWVFDVMAGNEVEVPVPQPFTGEISTIMEEKEVKEILAKLDEAKEAMGELPEGSDVLASPEADLVEEAPKKKRGPKKKTVEATE